MWPLLCNYWKCLKSQLLIPSSLFSVLLIMHYALLNFLNCTSETLPFESESPLTSGDFLQHWTAFSEDWLVEVAVIFHNVMQQVDVIRVRCLQHPFKEMYLQRFRRWLFSPSCSFGTAGWGSFCLHSDCRWVRKRCQGGNTFQWSMPWLHHSREEGWFGNVWH